MQKPVCLYCAVTVRQTTLHLTTLGIIWLTETLSMNGTQFNVMLRVVTLSVVDLSAVMLKVMALCVLPRMDQQRVVVVLFKEF
jgi:hypothetical protein